MTNQVDEGYLEWISVIIKFIFSWLILMPIAVIVTGKLLSKPINFGSDSKQVLKIPLKIFQIEANGGEVILGFACLIIILFLVAVIGGSDIYTLVKTNFGIDPGHFHSICFFSSLVSVIFSALLFIVHYLFTSVWKTSFVDDSKKYEATIEALAKRGKNNEYL
ncbi:hypothetical protein [Vibrio parahaemolyticus]|uniref:hypothetical protein n=2 Tax=Vibrio parahaemolyticus TaxID=670 RepID=UPI001A1F9F40|nr:hypothetical protein [Vibrio parahaemolyticus]EGR0399142.1 hypothetical protein [Vibrio parahaemolyticus]EGR0400651.1 hypothetical protein [Vibrio parahaemolyticus]MBE4730370.1 hypothetical protein [Vibrio parahaemolyticus]MBE4764459.1 hypothetical protein [Vibrio parahaemolyticus]MCI9721048.1 hypothetical protein [Vibrio parahaemolyticus]